MKNHDEPYRGAFLFGCCNLIWYLGSYKPYNDLQKDFPEIEASGSKIYVDEADLQYSVSVPKYLLWNGNLVISESNVQYALIIWQKPFGNGATQGILFNNYHDLNTQIMLKSSSEAEAPEDQTVVDRNLELISTLFEKANEVWHLELE